MNTPRASVLVPTRGRPGYLDVTLSSIMTQASSAVAEVIVISDGPDPATAEVARRHGAQLVELPAASGANAARNAGVAASAGELIVFIDDDIIAPDGWLAALLAGAASLPDVDVFGGPITALLEGGGPRACGREPAPITTLDLGPRDCDAEFVWSANMAVRARALRAVGAFDERIAIRGDEEDWLRRYKATGGAIRYLADAGLTHRREAADATVQALARAAWFQGRAARRTDVYKGSQTRLEGELRTFAGCVWHTLRRRCEVGIIMAAHSAGRVWETLNPVGLGAQPGDDFLSGESGQIVGRRASAEAAIGDAVADALALCRLTGPRLRAASRSLAPRRILALGIERTDMPNLMDAACAELLRSHHHVEIATRPAASAGKFENLNRLLEEYAPAGHDWLLVIDDDVDLPRGFLDDFLFLAERFDLTLAQPAHRAQSHAAWAVTRRIPGAIAHETRFVEIGPVTAFHARSFDQLLPFPELRFGWGLDNHWAAVARSNGWRLGVIDATPVRHGLRRIASAYDRSDAVSESRDFLADRPYVTAAEAQRPVAVYRGW